MRLASHNSDSEPLATSTEAYRRRARRVRAIHDSEPAAKLAALCDLARQSDARFTRIFGPDAGNSPTEKRRTDDVLDAILADLDAGREPSRVAVQRVAPKRQERRVIAALKLDTESTDSPAAVFAKEITECLDGDILRYSERQKLIRRATELGLSRFDANVVIAMVQNREGAADHSMATDLPAKPTNAWLAPIAIAAGMQLSIVAAIWWIASRSI